MLRITMTSHNIGADHAVRLARHLANRCGGFRYTVLSPFLRKLHKLEMVTDNYETERNILRLMSGDMTGWNKRVALRFLRTMAMVSVQYSR
jgi:hypothetical protein